MLEEKFSGKSEVRHVCILFTTESIWSFYNFASSVTFEMIAAIGVKFVAAFTRFSFKRHYIFQLIQSLCGFKIILPLYCSRFLFLSLGFSKAKDLIHLSHSSTTLANFPVREPMFQESIHNFTSSPPPPRLHLLCLNLSSVLLIWHLTK